MKNFSLSNEVKIVDPSEKLRNLTDQDLYRLCKNYGKHALRWRQKFIGLLPEVNRRKLYEKRGFYSIFEFAKKMAGLSEEQVRRVLNLEEKFKSLPNLQSLLVNGEVSANKLVRVASIANIENELFLAEQVKNLSQGAVETLVRDERLAMNTSKNLGGLGDKSVRAHTFEKRNELILSAEVRAKLLDLQQKGFDVNQLFLEFLQKREQDIAEKKDQISVKTGSRYIPQSVRKILKEEYGTKCAIKHCQKPAAQTHHILPFAMNRTHDPKLLVPLCKEHHELQHAVNFQYREIRNRATR